MHALPLFPVRGLWEFLHILIIFFLIQLKFLFIYLFIYSLQKNIQIDWEVGGRISHLATGKIYRGAWYVREQIKNNQNYDIDFHACTNTKLKKKMI